MSISERTKFLYENTLESAVNQPEDTFEYDMHNYGKIRYNDLDLWEKIARSTADAIVNQKIYIKPYDKLIGRIYHQNSKTVENPDLDLDYKAKALERIYKEFPEYDELVKNQLIGGGSSGHIAWNWDSILRMGTDAIKKMYRTAIEKTTDKKSIEFYSGVIIMLEALEEWNEKHIIELERLGMTEQAEICKKVPKYPAESFYEAVQSFFMQYIVVMRENPYGGNGPGRLDYYLWPYLEQDLKKGIITEIQARELIDELFIRIDERIHMIDMWVETIVVGGSYPDGSSAINPLSYIMIESMMGLNVTHPSVYVRLPEKTPDDFMSLCAKYVKDGSNRAQILSDKAIISALLESGVPYQHAVEYCCGGCMEIGIQGMTSDFLFQGWQNLLKIAELCTTGGYALNTGEQFPFMQAKGVEVADSFESFYSDFIAETTRLINLFFKAQEIFSEEKAKYMPSYLISSMVMDCFEKGRNMHDGGARYHDYGLTPIGLPNVADYLFAIKKAVFDEAICTKNELISAMKANYVGYEVLQKKLRAIPKYGQENDEADEFTARLFSDIANIFTSYRNRFGGMGKIIILTFIWAPEAAEVVGATADGSCARKLVAQGVTPQSSSMTKGITAAINSCTKMPFKVFNGGASTMWDLDPSLASEDVIKALLTTFFEQGGQIYQGNTTDVESLIKAQKNPEDYGNLIVRVGGYSARFIHLSSQVQNDIISRMHHTK